MVSNSDFSCLECRKEHFGFAVDACCSLLALQCRSALVADLACGRIRARRKELWKVDFNTDLQVLKQISRTRTSRSSSCHPKPFTLKPEEP